MDANLLVTQIQASDSRAARELYEAHVDGVYRLAYRMARDPDIARDLTQDVFIRVFQKIGNFRGESKLSTWIHQVALSVILNGLRSRRRYETRETSFGDDDGDTLVVSEYGNAGIDVDVRDRLNDAIDALPEQYREVFVMYIIEGYSHEEIAEALGVGLSVSRVRLHRAKERVRIALQDVWEDVAV